MLFQKSQKLSKWLVHFSHLLFIFSVIALLFSGLRIAVANEPNLIWLSMALPQGNIHLWHFRFAFILALACILYAVASILRKRLPPVRGKSKLTTTFQMTHYLGLVLLSTSLVTGTHLFFGIQFFPIELWLATHLFSAFGFVLYIVIHGLLAFSARPWRRVFDVFLVKIPSKPISISIIIAVVSLGLYSVLSLSQPDVLIVYQTQEKIDLDGDARENIWQKTPTTHIQTYQGYQHPSKGTQVTVQAAYDAENAYFLISWPDETRSQTHLPLIKTNEGWSVIQSGTKYADENEMYEDKFAIMLSASSQLAGAGTVHLGPSPVDRQPSPPNGRGLHYTTDNVITDVWHWKSVRTGLSLAQVDDNFFGPAIPSGSEYKRYTGGYQKDLDDCEHLIRWNGSDYETKPECGGFVMNWQIYDDDFITPIRLPKNPKLLSRLGEIDTDPTTSDFGSWWLNWSDTIAYNPDDDTYPVGTIMPSVLSLGPFSQGRGDVSAVGYWRDGQWQLELKRALNTQSKYDLAIENGIYFWVSAFDHSQTRHSYHIRPLKLVLE